MDAPQPELRDPVRGATLPADGASDAPLSARAWYACLAGLIALQTFLVDRFVPFREVFSPLPLRGIDYDLHIGQVYRVTESLLRTGHSWSYDVQLLAGQPEGTITDSGSKGWELWTFALHALGVPLPMAFNSFVAFAMLAAPFVVGAAARTFGWSRGVSLAAAAMVSTLWFFDSQLHWMWFVGMISWSFAACLALLTLALFTRFLERRTWGLALASGATLSIGLLIHPYTFFVLVVPMVVGYARAFRTLSRVGHAQVGLIGFSALAVNAFWLHNAAKHWHYILDSAYYAQANTKYLLCDYFDLLCNGADSGVIGTRTGFRFLYFGLAIAGFALLRARRDARFVPLVSCFVPLLVVAYFGEFLPGMQQSQPYRQAVPALLLSTLPAAAFCAEAWSALRSLGRGSSVRWLVGALGFALVQLLLATQVLYYFPEWVPEPAVHPDGARSPLSAYGHVSHPDLPVHVRYRVPHDPQVLERGMEQVIRWLERYAARGDRVLIEGAVMGERVAWRTGFEVLGGFFERNLEHVDANYFRKYRTMPATRAQLVHYLNVYAVQWIVTKRPEFAGVPELEEVSAGEFERVYRVRAPANRVVRGGGQVFATQNLIEVRNSDPNQPVVIAYHWHEALRCKPNCRVEREKVDIDRVGFIRIPAPHPADVTIWNSYEGW